MKLTTNEVGPINLATGKDADIPMIEIVGCDERCSW